MKKIFSFFFLFVFTIFLFSCAGTTGNNESNSNIVTPTNSDHNHEYVEHAKVDPTCEEAGNIKYFTCSSCDKYFDESKNEITQDKTVLAATGHNYEFEKFNWSSDYSSAEAVYVCKNDHKHLSTRNATVTSKENLATCDSEGSIVYTAVCGNDTNIKTLVRKKADHDYEIAGFQWEADYSSAMAYYKCENNENHTDKFKADIEVEIVPATCEKSGTKTITASHNGNSDTIIIALNATGHSFTDNVINPTCEEGGYTNHVCANCDYAYKDTFTEKLGHKWDHVADCEHGSHCERCNAALDKLGHDYKLKETKDANCEKPKTYVYKCDRCNDEYEVTEGIALGHNIEGVTAVEKQVKGETCEYVLTYDCNNCDAIIEGDHVFHHEYTATIVTEATCSSTGLKRYTCSKCNDTYTEEIPVDPEHGHIWNEGTPEGGQRIDTCSLCNTTRKVQVFDGKETSELGKDELKNNIQVNNANIALDESLVNDVIGDKNVKLSVDTLSDGDKSALNISEDQMKQLGDNKVYNFGMTDGTNPISTFGADNYVTITLPYELGADEDVDNIAVWFINDSGELESIKATYNNGYVTFKTNHFSYYAVTRLTPAQRCELYGHQYVKQHVDGDCTHDSYDLSVCIRCYDKQIEITESATGHNYLIDTEESHNATCITNGIKVYVCEYCNDTYSNTILATGHNYEKDNTNSISTSCNHTGKDVYECLNCHDTYETIIPMISHTYQTSTVEATCTSYGYTLHECSVCHESYKDNYTNPATHSVSFDWADDFKSATITLECSSNQEHNHTETVTAKELTITATCTRAGEIVYSVSAEINGITYSDSKTKEVEALPHTKGDEWLHDGDKHWHECSVCHAKLDETDHTWTNNKCTICGAGTCDHEPTIRKFFNINDYYSDCCGFFVDYYECECGHFKTNIGNHNPVVSLCPIESNNMTEEQLPNGDYFQVVECPICGFRAESTYSRIDYTGTMVIYYDNQELFNIFIASPYKESKEFSLRDYSNCGGYIRYYEDDEGNPIAINYANINCYDYLLASGQIKVAQETQNRLVEVTTPNNAKTEKVIDGIKHTIIDLTCSDCGLQYLVDTYTITNGCIDHIHTHMKISKDNETVFEVLDDIKDQENHKKTYEVLVSGDIDCYSKSVPVLVRCSECDDYYLDYVSSHKTIEKKLDFASFGGTGSITYKYCEVCKKNILTYNEIMNAIERGNITVDETTSAFTTETDSKGSKHEIMTAKISNTNITIKIDRYQEMLDTCRYISHSIVTLTNGNDELLSYDYHYSSSNHNYVSKYTFETADQDCSKGVKVTQTCTKCHDSYSYTITGHEKVNRQEIDLSKYGVNGTVYSDSCACGKEKNVDVEMREGIQSNYSTYKDDAGRIHDVYTYKTKDNSFVYTKDSYAKATSTKCEYQYITVHTIRYNQELVFNGTSLEYVEMHKFDQISYDFMTDDHDCEKGVYIKRICSVCGKIEREEIHYHESFELERYDINSSTCDGYIVLKGCACGEHKYLDFDYINCDLDRNSCEMFVSDYYKNGYHEAYISKCAVEGCGFTYRYAEYYENSDTCSKQFVQIYQLGYNEATGEYVKEIVLKQGYSKFHEYEINTTETTENGNKVETETRTCKYCGNKETTINIYDKNNRRISRINEYIAEDGSTRRNETTYIYNNGREYELSYKDYILYENGNNELIGDYEYQYNFDICERTFIDNINKGKTYTNTFHNYYYLDSSHPCTQGYGEYCINCGHTRDEQDGVGHTWILDENGGYICNVCGLKSSVGADGDIVLENLSYEYSDTVIIGYYNKSYIEFGYYISAKLKDSDDDIIISEEDIKFIENYNGMRAIAFSLTDLRQALTNKGVSETAEFDGFKFVCVPVDASGTLDYSITLFDND